MSILVGGMCSICCHDMALVLAFMHLYNILIRDCFCPFFFFNIFLKSGIEAPTGQWYQHLLTLFAIFYKSSTEETNFQIMFVCFSYVDVMCMFCIVFNLCVKFELVKSLEVTLHS